MGVAIGIEFDRDTDSDCDGDGNLPAFQKTDSSCPIAEAALHAKRQHPDLWITFEQTAEGKKVLARYNARKAKSAP